MLHITKNTRHILVTERNIKKAKILAVRDVKNIEDLRGPDRCKVMAVV